MSGLLLFLDLLRVYLFDLHFTLVVLCARQLLGRRVWLELELRRRVRGGAWPYPEIIETVWGLGRSCGGLVKLRVAIRILSWICLDLVLLGLLGVGELLSEV